MGFASFLNIGPWPLPPSPPGSSARNYCIWTQLGTFCNFCYNLGGQIWDRGTAQQITVTFTPLGRRHWTMGILYKNLALYGWNWTISHITDCWYSQQAKVAIHKQVQVQVAIHKQVQVQVAIHKQVQVAIHKWKCLLAISCHWKIFVCTFYRHG